MNENDRQHGRPACHESRHGHFKIIKLPGAAPAMCQRGVSQRELGEAPVRRGSSPQIRVLPGASAWSSLLALADDEPDMCLPCRDTCGLRGPCQWRDRKFERKDR
jgi:hypothetical protein